MVLDPPSEFDEMSKSDRDRLLLLCKEYFQPIKSINTKRSSYWLKHRIQWVDNGMYCTCLLYTSCLRAFILITKQMQSYKVKGIT